MHDRGPYLSGRGAVSCFGIGVDRLLGGIYEGAVGIRPFERLAGTDCLTTVAAEVPADVREAVADPHELPLHMAESAAREALGSTHSVSDSTMLVVATTKADMTGIVTEGGQGFGNPHQLALQLQDRLGLSGPVAAVSTACASGLSALIHAGRSIRRGRVDHALVVGTDALNPFIARGFGALLALSPEPARPFDKDRRGLSVGEGAGAILLSSQPSPYFGGCALAGWGQSNDANHITGPCRDGSGLAIAIRRALEHGDVRPADVDLLHMHGTGTPYNDAMENRAVAAVFDSSLDSPPAAAASKGQIGHTLGAAGVLESLIAVAALERGAAPPTPGLRTPDTDSVLRISPEPQPIDGARHGLKLAAGFGGINVALLFRRMSA